MKHVPNILTICRFVLIPFIVSEILYKNFIVAFILLTISGITDVLDGMIARKYNFITNFGKLIDPVADKCTQIATLIALTNIHMIPQWILVVILSKEAVMIAGAAFLYGKKLIVGSRWFGKLATTLFYIAIVSTFMINYFNIQFGFDIYLYYIAISATIFALFMYFINFIKQGYVNKEELNVNNMEVISKKKNNRKNNKKQ